MGALKDQLKIDKEAFSLELKDGSQNKCKLEMGLSTTITGLLKSVKSMLTKILKSGKALLLTTTIN